MDRRRQKDLSFFIGILGAAIAAFLASHPLDNGVSKEVVYWVSVTGAVLAAVNSFLPKAVD